MEPDGPAEFELIERKTFSLFEHAEHALETMGGATSGPHPPPPWLITDLYAVDDDLGVLKSGKEAVVSLVERRLGEHAHLLARKDYREVTQRSFRQDTNYRDGRSRRRGQQALFDAGGRRGLLLRAAEWRQREFAVLGELWEAGLPVPYPVSMSGESVLMQYLGDEDGAAPRLVDVRVEDRQLRELCGQFTAAVREMFEIGYVHGDLSPYNLLVWRERLWFIDFPQAVSVQQSADWAALLHRDVANVCGWFTRQGLELDIDEVFEDVSGGAR